MKTLTSCKVLRDFFALLRGRHLTTLRMAAITGKHRTVFSRWKYGKNSPTLIEFETVCEQLGYRLILERIEPHELG